MIAAAPAVTKSEWQNSYPDTLENGAHHGATEFLRRYEAMPEVKKAELVNGIVYMASPLRLDQHGEPDSLVQAWLGMYAIATPGVKSATNSTVLLGRDDVLQPDGLLRLLPEHGGKGRLTAKGYMEGPPELVVEVAASSASLDTREKLISYRRAGVGEYLVWRTDDNAIDWWGLKDDEYRPLSADADGLYRSRLFPGLWLDASAMVARDGAKVMGKLQEGLQSKAHVDFVAQLQTRASDLTPPI